MYGLGGRRRQSFRRRNYLPYQLVRRFQRDLLIGLGLIVGSAIVLLIISAATEPFSVRLIEEGPSYSAQTADGAECQIYETRKYEETGGEVRAMIDCGDQRGTTIASVFQYLFLAVLGVGVVLASTGGFALMAASRMSSDLLVLPVCIIAIIGGIVAVAWGLTGDFPGLAIQGIRERAVTGVLRPGGALTNKDSAVAWGIGLMSAATLRVSRL